MATQGTVLIIDDDKTLLRLLQEALTKAGYQVILTSNGIDGLQEMYARQPDLVLLDVMMPRMDGWETLSRIRQISRVPVIMLTAKDGEQEKVRGFNLGLLLMAAAMLHLGIVPDDETRKNCAFRSGKMRVIFHRDFNK